MATDPNDITNEYNLNDKEARIKARQNRIEKRNASKNDEKKSKKTQVVESSKLSKSQQQISDSLNQLDKNKISGIQAVTNIRVDAENTENLRRIQEEERRKKTLQTLQDEAITSGKRNAAIEMRWSELLEYSMPQELFNAINSQKNACETVINFKNDLIKDFQNQLKVKDEQYVKALKYQAEDIENLVEKMEQQYKEMQEEYDIELEQIEDSFLKERDELLQSNKIEIDALFDKRRESEMGNMERRQLTEEKNQKEIEDLRIKDAEDYNKLKIKLETDIQTLEQQLEEMRATYQLNTEKLEYNYRVLTERDMENSATLSQQKKKLSRLKDVLSSLKQKYTQTESKDRHQNQGITEEYKRITKQYKDLQQKSRNFDLSDEKKYKEVWSMHFEEILEMKKKVFNADKIIHEQQLGLFWKDSIKEIPDPYLDTSQDMQLETSPNKTLMAEEKLSDQDIRGSFMSSEESNKFNKFPLSKIKIMLDMIAQEAGFLIDPETKKSLDTYPSDEANIVRADKILGCLGVTNEVEMERLLQYFFNYSDTANKTKSITGLKVDPDQVIKVIQQFIEDTKLYKKDKEQIFTTSISSCLKKTSKLIKDPDIVEIASKKEEQYWNQVSSVLPKKTIRVWTALDKGLTEYNKILKRRSNLVDEMSALSKQNTELKSLLKQYLGSKVNDELIISPVQTIRISEPTGMIK